MADSSTKRLYQLASLCPQQQWQQLTLLLSANNHFQLSYTYGMEEVNVWPLHVLDRRLILWINKEWQQDDTAGQKCFFFFPESIMPSVGYMELLVETENRFAMVILWFPQACIYLRTSYIHVPKHKNNKQYLLLSIILKTKIVNMNCQTNVMGKSSQYHTPE